MYLRNGIGHHCRFSGRKHVIRTRSDVVATAMTTFHVASCVIHRRCWHQITSRELPIPSPLYDSERGRMARHADFETSGSHNTSFSWCARYAGRRQNSGWRIDLETAWCAARSPIVCVLECLGHMQVVSGALCRSQHPEHIKEAGNRH